MPLQLLFDKKKRLWVELERGVNCNSGPLLSILLLRANQCCLARSKWLDRRSLRLRSLPRQVPDHWTRVWQCSKDTSVVPPVCFYLRSRLESCTTMPYRKTQMDCKVFAALRGTTAVPGSNNPLPRPGYPTIPPQYTPVMHLCSCRDSQLWRALHGHTQGNRSHT